ncbi:MAG: hypothetical protein JKY81_05385 [Colwellia sp.]|nr:hypothetical protein [Colwellia sp.]
MIDKNNELNVNYLFSFYTSSKSHWEKHATGHPLDGYQLGNRFSFHTEDEYDPFITLSCDEYIDLSSFEIVLRDKYENKILPLKVYVSFNKIEWSEIFSTEYNEDNATLTYKNLKGVKYLKITKEGYTCLYLSSVNFYSDCKYIERNASRLNNIEKNNNIISYTPFYGLGGQLAVLATTIGQALNSRFKHCFWTWRDYQSGLVQFPPELPNNAHTELLLKENISSTVLANFQGNRERQKSSKSVTSWLPENGNSDSDNPLVIISRDSINQFILKGESKFACMRRLYSKIQPSIDVLHLVRNQEKVLAKKDIDFTKSLGLQVRHGNGEQYTSGNVWGVKPPSKDELIMAVNIAIKNSESKLDSLIIASDCFAVRDLLTNVFGGSYKIHFLSENIQPIGGGGNPQEKRFDLSVKRIVVDMEFDDKQAFSEILTLAKCNDICGGKSFFFDAIIGFGATDESNITRVNNNDRYIELPNNLVPLSEAINYLRYQEIVNEFRSNNILLDGIFIDVNEIKKIKISFFDTPLFEGSYKQLKKELSRESIIKKLVNYRYY